MKVLLLYQFANHKNLVRSVCDQMRIAGVHTDAFNIQTGEALGHMPNYNGLLAHLFTVLPKIPKVAGLFFRFIVPFIIKRISQTYDIIDIHYYGLSYNKLIPYWKKKKKKIKITIWGSDFYRSSENNRKKQNLGYKGATVIQVATKRMYSDFIKIYPQYCNKLQTIHFGLTQLDELKELMNSEYIVDTPFFQEYTQKRICITCGYNGSEGQQHEQILSALKNLPNELKNKILVVIPATYGLNPEYKERLKGLATQTGIATQILDKPLSQKDILTLRLISDIVINMQKTDAFSASLQEHLMAGSVLLVGEWLPYDILEENDIFYIKCSFANLKAKLENAINNLEDTKKKCKKNKIGIYNLSSWQAVRETWANIYRKMYK